jgi:hypothetical protein
VAQPPRHGHRWNQVPTPLEQGATGVAIRGSLTPAAGPAPAITVIPVKEVDLFLRALPKDNVSFMSRAEEVRYNHSLGIGNSLTVSSLAVPRGYVWVLSDLELYALGPSTELNGAPKNLSREALVGILKLEVLFGGTSPLQTTSHRMEPYTTPGQAAATTSGWPWLERNFGPQRMLTFALQARENTTIDIVATVEAVPRFPISKIGVNIHGFSAPITVFDSVVSDS